MHTCNIATVKTDKFKQLNLNSKKNCYECNQLGWEAAILNLLVNTDT